MNALADGRVGSFVNRYFVSTFVKVATFQVVNGQKQGGNVASYFCRPDGSVLHLIAGPTDARHFLEEAMWVHDIHKRAQLASLGAPERYKDVIFDAHAQLVPLGVSKTALAQLHRASQGGFGDFRKRKDLSDPVAVKKYDVLHSYQHVDPRSRVSLLLALFPTVKIGDVYPYVFESILKERISDLPVAER